MTHSQDALGPLTTPVRSGSQTNAEGVFVMNSYSWCLLSMVVTCYKVALDTEFVEVEVHTQLISYSLWSHFHQLINT